MAQELEQRYEGISKSYAAGSPINFVFKMIPHCATSPKKIFTLMPVAKLKLRYRISADARMLSDMNVDPYDKTAREEMEKTKA